MRFDIFTLFPDVFFPYINTSILQRACANHIVEINVHNIRDWSKDKHHTTDDTPFGGGGGMVMKPEPIFDAVEGVAEGQPDCPVVLMTPQGPPAHPRAGRTVQPPAALDDLVRTLRGRG